MEVLECLQCRGQIVVEENGQTGKCVSCDTMYFFKAEKNARLISLLNQANISRLRGDFDSAILAYKIALKEDETDADAYWGITLSKFGIEYVEDERTKRIFPTCRRTVKHSILSDEDYLKALSFASEEQKEDYQQKAEEIEKLQVAIKDKVEKEQDYDVFLCFKSSDKDGNPTEDRFIARQIYNQLEKQNIRTFFSEITLKDRLGEDYEPIIYKALYTAKIFILIATKEEFIQAPWVRNEWSRFRDRMLDEGLSNVSFAVFKDIKQNQLPPIFRSQGVDLAKYPAGGYEVEIADNLVSRLKGKKFSSLENMFSDSSSMIFEEKVVDLLEKKLIGTRQTYEEKIERAITYHEIGNTEKSLEILEGIIDEYPRKAMGWFYKAQLLTLNFEINITEFHTDEELKSSVLFSLENAERFASEEEKQVINEKTEKFYKKVKTLEGVDENLKGIEEGIEKYFNLENEKKLNSLQNEKATDSEQGYTQALEINAKELKQLKKQISNKKYYIKNISMPTTFMQSFFQMIGFIIIIIAITGSLINYIRAGGDNTKIFRALIEFILLSMVGFSPFFITSQLKKNAKLKQVKSYIENDKKKFNELISQNHEIKSLLMQSQLEAKEKQCSDFEIDESYASVENQIAENYKTVRKLFDENEFVKEYVYFFEEREGNAISIMKRSLEGEKKLLEREKEQIKEQKQQLLKELREKKPKYLSESYEKLAKNTTMLIERIENKTKQIKQSLTEIDLETKLLNFKLQKKVSNNDFLQDFLTNHKHEIEEYLSQKPKEENLTVKVDDLPKVKKSQKKKKKKKKHNSKK